METKELEKMAYLYLCSPKDREKILGRKPMSYDDFQRLYYLAEYIGFPAFALAFFNRYAENFQVQESVLEKSMMAGIKIYTVIQSIIWKSVPGG